MHAHALLTDSKILLCCPILIKLYWPLHCFSGQEWPSLAGSSAPRTKHEGHPGGCSLLHFFYIYGERKAWSAICERAQGSLPNIWQWERERKHFACKSQALWKLAGLYCVVTLRWYRLSPASRSMRLACLFMDNTAQLTSREPRSFPLWIYNNTKTH